LLKIFIFR